MESSDTTHFHIVACSRMGGGGWGDGGGSTRSAYPSRSQKASEPWNFPIKTCSGANTCHRKQRGRHNACLVLFPCVNGNKWTIMSHLYGLWMDWRSRCEVLLLLPGALDVVRNGKPHLACNRTAWQLQIGLFVLISVVSHVLRLTLSHLGHIAKGYYRRLFMSAVLYHAITVRLCFLYLCHAVRTGWCEKMKNHSCWETWALGLEGREVSRERREDCLHPRMSFL